MATTSATELKGLWRLDSIPLALQLCFEGLCRMQSDFSALPHDFMPATIWPKPYKVARLLFNAIAAEDLTSTISILDACTARLEKHIVLLVVQANRCLGHATFHEVPRSQMTLAGLVCQVTLLTQQTIHEAGRCAVLLMPANATEEKHSRNDESAAEAALSVAHQGIARYLDVMVEQKQPVDEMLRGLQLEQICSGGKWQSAMRGCLVNVHMHHALVLAAQHQDIDQQLLIFAAAAHPHQPMLTYAALLVKEIALANCFVGRSVLRVLVHILKKWKVEVPLEVLSASG